jgi:hypothetical protein
MFKVLVATLVLACSVTVWAETLPVAVVAGGDSRPHYVLIDRLAVNLNAVALMEYDRGLLTVTYVNGTNATFSMKLTAEEWKKIQFEILKASGQ